MHLVNSTGNSPSPGRPTPGVVKQDKSSGGSVDTTKTRSDPQRVRMSSGERPIGAAKGKQSDTEAFCQPPPPPQGVGQTVPASLGVSACLFHFPLWLRKGFGRGVNARTHAFMAHPNCQGGVPLSPLAITGQPCPPPFLPVCRYYATVLEAESQGGEGCCSEAASDHSKDNGDWLPCRNRCDAQKRCPPSHTRPLLSGWLILYRRVGGWVGGSEAKKKFVYLKSTSKFGPL